MKNRKRFITIFFIIAVLVLGVGYAAITTVNLTITGDATATPNDANFKVAFNGTKTQDNCTATVTEGSKSATITITGDNFSKAGDTATATFEIDNDSTDMAANVSISVADGYDKTNFTVTPTINPATVQPGSTATATVVVKLNTTPITTDLTTDFTINIKADATAKN